ncbi:MAG: 6-phosphogluconolactonase [Odoribacter sp.]|nr:6-phosphogluconolactonase [Odoribacter sp.]
MIINIPRGKGCVSIFNKTTDNQLNTSIKIFQTPYDLAEKFAEELVIMINESTNKKPFTIALSGGATPELLFSILGDHFSNSVSWEFVHFFWGDERCVPPDDPASNYGITKRAFLDKIKSPSANIHRIMGESHPTEEAERYSQVIREFTVQRKGFPMFDLIILGIGEDGHTASIFPGSNKLFISEKICEAVIHPVTFQRRITITGMVINNACKVVFLVTGKNKAKIISSIIKGPETIDFPAALINPVTGTLTWYLDVDAAKLIEKKNL